MRAYITANALEDGIQALDGEVNEFGSFYVTYKTGALHVYFKGEWFETWEEALDDAERQREEAIEELEAIVFEEPK